MYSKVDDAGKGKETKRGKILKVLLLYIASPLVIYIASAPPP